MWIEFLLCGVSAGHIHICALVFSRGVEVREVEPRDKESTMCKMRPCFLSGWSACSPPIFCHHLLLAASNAGGDVQGAESQLPGIAVVVLMWPEGRQFLIFLPGRASDFEFAGNYS